MSRQPQWSEVYNGGAQTLVEAHHQAKLYRPTAIIVAQLEDEVIAVRSAKAPQGTGWKLPQGGIEVDELVYEAARRELGEETGLEIHEHDLAFSLRGLWATREWPADRPPRDGFELGKLYVATRAHLNTDYEQTHKQVASHNSNGEVDTVQLMNPAELLERIEHEPDSASRTRRLSDMSAILGRYSLL